jgi:hypothetical protein
VQALSQLLCQIAKSFSGVMGDLLGSQVKILVFGTALTAISKPMFALSSVVFTSFGGIACLWCIMLGKMMDRVSKGFREAPTKALISQTARDAGETADAAFSTVPLFPALPQSSNVLLHTVPGAAHAATPRLFA